MEGEREYAARGGRADAIYTWGNIPSHDQANYGAKECCAGAMEGKDRWEFTSPVDSFAPNDFGLYDMAGNIWEWVQDCYAENYAKAHTDGSAVIAQGCQKRVIRGGAWYGNASSLRCSKRSGLEPEKYHSGGGFRCAQSESDMQKP